MQAKTGAYGASERHIMLILSLALSLQLQATIWQGCNCCLVCLHACGRSGGGQGRGGWIAAQNRQGRGLARRSESTRTAQSVDSEERGPKKETIYHLSPASCVCVFVFHASNGAAGIATVKPGTKPRKFVCVGPG